MWGWGGWGGFGSGGFGDATTQVENQRVNHLVLDIFSSSSHKLLFRGVADGDLSNNSEKNSESLGKDLQEMFRKFPAGDKHQGSVLLSRIDRIIIHHQSDWNRKENL